jgi:hypothetical protein
MDRPDEEDQEAMMKTALEFMIALRSAQSGTVNKVEGWAATILRGCWERMGTLRNDDLEEADVRTPFAFARRNYIDWGLTLNYDRPSTIP